MNLDSASWFNNGCSEKLYCCTSGTPKWSVSFENSNILPNGYQNPIIDETTGHLTALEARCDATDKSYDFKIKASWDADATVNSETSPFSVKVVYVYPC
jgi:hypothetical protein